MEQFAEQKSKCGEQVVQQASAGIVLVGCVALSDLLLVDNSITWASNTATSKVLATDSTRRRCGTLQSQLQPNTSVAHLAAAITASYLASSHSMVTLSTKHPFVAQ
ncbi:unnamed protein product [Toxocara canis]|uniref:Uncharacterized protein n=1 Tax=Toxocara canis TaxID=6265 RepID=A0A183V4E3_TOXCA|nr:unnamed protein product [Toxocara canis]